MDESPDTVSDATRLLVRDGYTATFECLDDTADQLSDEHHHDLAALIIERQYRFEGDSNPDDSAIVLGVHCPACEERGIVVSAYGPDADPTLLAKLHYPS